MPMDKKPVVKPKSKLTGADITGQKYNTKIKEEAAKIRLKVKLKEKITPYEKSVLGSDAAIKKMNTKPAEKTKPKVAPKPKVKPKPKPKAPAPKTKKYRDATDIPGFLFGKGTE
jgi:hypothetical protein